MTWRLPGQLACLARDLVAGDMDLVGDALLGGAGLRQFHAPRLCSGVGVLGGG